MESIETLRDQNKRLKKIIQDRKELEEDKGERKRLLKERKYLMMAVKMSPEKLERNNRRVARIRNIVNKLCGWFMAWARRIKEAEIREKELENKKGRKKG